MSRRGTEAEPQVGDRIVQLRTSVSSGGGNTQRIWHGRITGVSSKGYEIQGDHDVKPFFVRGRHILFPDGEGGFTEDRLQSINVKRRDGAAPQPAPAAPAGAPEAPPAPPPLPADDAPGEAPQAPAVAPAQGRPGAPEAAAVAAASGALAALESTGADGYAAWLALGRELVAREKRAADAAREALARAERELEDARALVAEQERAVAEARAAVEAAELKAAAMGRRVGEE